MEFTAVPQHDVPFDYLEYRFLDMISFSDEFNHVLFVDESMKVYTFNAKYEFKYITPFSDGLSVLKGINPVTFRYNGKAGFSPDEKYVGIIAQEIQKVAPYTISTFKAKLDSTDKTETELLRFDPNALFYITINAVKELDTKVTEIERLREENKSLSERLNNLEEAVKSLTSKKTEGGSNSMGKLQK